MTKQYESLEELKLAVDAESKGTITAKEWVLLEEVLRLFSHTFHSPFDDIDVKEAWHILQRLRQILNEKDGTLA